MKIDKEISIKRQRNRIRLDFPQHETLYKAVKHGKKKMKKKEEEYQEREFVYWIRINFYYMTDNKVVEWGSGTGDTFRKQKSHIEARKQIVSFDFPWCVLFDGENWCGPARVRQLRRERPYLRPKNRLSRWLTFKSVFVSFYVFKRNIFPVDWDGKDRRRKKGETRKIQFIIESQHGERRKKTEKQNNEANKKST